MNPTSFKKLCRLLQQSNILSLKTSDQNKLSLQYGPLGSLLKRNIFQEWLNFHLNIPDAHVLPIENSIASTDGFHVYSTPDRNNEVLIREAAHHYKLTEPIHNHQLPLGIALYGPCTDTSREATTYLEDIDLSILRNWQTWTRLSLVFFCPQKKGMHWLYFWSKQRYLWWRKFSSAPSKFFMSDIADSSPSGQHMTIDLEFADQKIPIERISIQESQFLEMLSRNDDDFDRSLLNDVSVITCEMKLELAVLAYLANSLAEKWRDEEMKQVFHLHYKLAPLKASLFLEACDADGFKKLKNVASHLATELKNAGVPILPKNPLGAPTLKKSQFDRFDQMGIPYTIVLSEHSLQSGIAGLRNRDTTLQEQVHIAEITAKLQRYLKIL